MKPFYSLFGMMLMLMLFVQSPPTIVAGGFGVSGTFAGHSYTMIPGETSSSSNVSIVFFNQYDVAITVRLHSEGPLGVSYLNLQEEYTIEATSQLRIPIIIELSDMVAPGSYVLNVYAQVLPSDEEGITLIGSAGLQANLLVLGEAGMLNISVVSVNGLTFPAVLELFRVDEDTLVSVTRNDIEIASPYAASDYLVRAYYESRQVAESFFTLSDQEELTIELVAQTLLIQSFRVVPMFENQFDVLSTALIMFELDNIYKPVNDVSVLLNVTYQQSAIEAVEILQSSSVSVGSTTGQFTFYPSQGWRAGEYTFELVLNNVQKSLDASITMVYQVPREVIEDPGLFEGRTSWFIAMLVIGGIGLGGAFWWVVRVKKSSKRKTQPTKTTTFSNERSR
jgi:hypothetical protein